MYYKISEVSQLLCVHTQTIRRWDREGKIRCIRTPGGHRRIHRDEVSRIIERRKRIYKRRKRGVAIYGRVSAYDHTKNGDLDRQVQVPRFFPSSKLCSNCDCIKKDLTLASRVYSCTNCGLKKDRDVNAALNLRKYGRCMCQILWSLPVGQKP